MKKISLLLAPVVGAIVSSACTSTTSSLVVACGPDDVATTNWDIVATTNYEAGWYFAALDPVPLSFFGVTSGTIIAVAATSNNAATLVAASAGQNFPNSCASATANGNVVTFMLDNCSGPLGLVGTTGTITATFNLVSNALQIQLAGTGVHANGATLNLATSGTFTVNASGQKTLDATTQTSGTGPDGNSVTLGSFTLVWPTGTGCATINGNFSGIGSGTFAGTTTQISNYVACTGMCPRSGMTVSSFNGGTATLTFNGTSNAQCSASDGTSGSIPLRCP